MKLSLLLHFYQPYNQQEDILHRIVKECYEPLTEGLLKIKNARVGINISGVLAKTLVDKRYTKVIQNIKKGVENEQIELISTSGYHAFLPLLPDSEIIRQIDINDEINKSIFGGLYRPTGFFPPEMSVSPKVLKIIAGKGYKWIGVPQVSLPNGFIEYDKLYQDVNSDLFFLARNKRVSSLMLSGVCRDSKDLIKETSDIQTENGYWFCVMDAETFGHHRIGHQKFLFDILNNKFFQSVLPSDISSLELLKTKVNLRPSTWTNEEQDFWMDKDRTKRTETKAFILWKDPTNPIHKLQWEMTKYVIDTVGLTQRRVKPNVWVKPRTMLDYAISSDQYWWASAKPWWSLEMVEQGAYSLKEVIKVLLGESSKEYKKALDYYTKIIDKAFEWQRTGYIRKRHLENSSTYMKTPFVNRAPAEWYNQMMLEFEDEMKKSAEKLDFEKAIKWRDALEKIRLKTDIYDILHVVDELWTARSIPSVKPFLDHKNDEFSDFIQKYFKAL